MKRWKIAALFATTVAALAVLVAADIRAASPSREAASPGALVKDTGAGKQAAPKGAAAAGASSGAPEGAGATPEADSSTPAGFSRSPIRLDAAQRQAIGLTYGVAERRTVETVIRTVGRFDYDERRLAEVTLKVGGWIHELFVDYTGKAVRKGDPLFSIYSPDLVSAEQEYLLALETEARLRGSRVPGAAESAAQLVDASRERLRLWDLTDQQIRALAENRKPKLYQTFYSPISGVVIEKTAFKGHRVEPGMTLYKIADLSTLWVYADVYEYEVPFVRVGQEAKITLSYVPGETFSARVAYVYPTLDPKTRTVKVRFELPSVENPGLRPEMYGNVELRIPAGERLVVPNTAVLDAGRRQVVFIDEGEGRLAPRQVRVGTRFDDSIEIIEGLKPGERVVTSANFLVDSESKLQAAESMMGMMGAIGMGDWKMESARPMEMGGGEGGVPPAEPQAQANIAEQPMPDEKRVGEFMVAVFPAERSATVAQTSIRVRVHSTEGKPVTGAKVRFNYTMDMPGMTIEQSETKELGDGLYEGMATFTMGGPWGLVVEIEAGGKPPARGKFTIRVAG